MNKDELWCDIELYNEYLKKITSLLGQYEVVDKMEEKAKLEIKIIEDKKDESCYNDYLKRLKSTSDQCEKRKEHIYDELRFIQKLKKDMESKIEILKI